LLGRPYRSRTCDTLRRELRQLAAINLEEATFEEKRDITNKLGIMVYPSEDLKTMRVKCGLKLTVERDNNLSIGEDGRGIVMFGLPASEGCPCPVVKIDKKVPCIYYQ
jgi:hypothetical protein